MSASNGRPEAQDDTTETTADELVFVTNAQTSSRRIYHSSRDCHLLAQTDSTIREVTRERATEIEERTECSSTACGDSRSHSDENDPLRVLRKLGYDSVHGGA
ncbi:hypothetical protein Hbl1158_10065 [Halobaculum sp. CBA1158]|uniref:hypothetical protein n=1 Tax=Halobaculum sp. CBA1158 TaxID=2904243 RepID=UPI001F36AAC7|nr:hypothetical protein [Halobaculum sp. CBA1158]UIO98878.1 hypothetical protein Hbl1158_10065 [Halobaculum sp. CBA1158]